MFIYTVLVTGNGSVSIPYNSNLDGSGEAQDNPTSDRKRIWKVWKPGWNI
jgi:hypothetical protein